MFIVITSHLTDIKEEVIIAKSCVVDGQTNAVHFILPIGGPVPECPTTVRMTKFHAQRPT
jgi:hypothetical protein